MKLAQVLELEPAYMSIAAALRYSGLDSELLEEGIRIGAIKSYSLRQRPARDGRKRAEIRLIDRESIIFFITHFADLYKELEAKS